MNCGWLVGWLVGWSSGVVSRFGVCPLGESRYLGCYVPYYIFYDR